ncbi:MAG: Ig domain-containing protein, partial [Clostridia bacterium]|nr:Ig domain-containing protein [Clostridia bacterium]
QGGIIGQANKASESYKIADLRDRIDVIRIAWIADKAVNPSLPITDLWDRLIKADIIATYDDVEGPEKDETGNDIYILNTKDGYTVEIIVNDKGHVTIGDIVKGALPPVVRRIEASTTDTGILAKAIVSRLKNGTVEYWYKLSTENDSEYKKMNFVSNEEGAKVDLTPVEGTTYVVKVVAKNEAGEHELTAEITIGVKVKGITLDKTTAIVAPNGTLQLVPSIIPENAENKKLAWTSSNQAVATVDENGLVTGETVGNAIITATTTDESNLSATCNLTVKIPVTGISLNKTSAKVEIGKTINLIATVEPENATNKEIKWESSNTSIATVSNTGVVTGVANGTVTITATSLDNETIKKTCSVEVTEESNWEELEKIAKAISKSGISSETKTATGTTEDGIDYKITAGDIFKVKYNGTTRRVRVLGFNHDDLVSTSAYKGQTSTKAGISFEFLDCMTGTDQWAMNDNSNTNSGGWTGTTIRGKLNNSKPKLSNSSYIKQVKKPYATTYNTDSLSSTPANDYLWLLSCTEIWGSSSASGCKSGYSKTTEGSQYKFYKDLAPVYNSGKGELIKKIAETDSAAQWWLRSPHSYSYDWFCTVYSNGYCNNRYARNVIGVAPGFCI